MCPNDTDSERRPESLNDFLDREWPALKAFIRKVTSEKWRNRELTEDHAQDGIRRFLELFPPETVVQPEDRTHMSRLLRRIAKNTLIDTMRGRTRRSDVTGHGAGGSDDEGRSPDPAGSFTGIQTNAGRSEARQLLNACIALLEEDDALVIVMRDFEHRDDLEIAAELGITGPDERGTKANIRMRYRRATKRLRGILAEVSDGRLPDLLS